MRDMPERHRSIRAAFDHSWALLSEEERRAFRKLAFFRGGFATQAAQTIAGVSQQVLSTLADKSLVYKTSADRYTMHELLQQYAAEKLDEVPQEKAETQDRYCAYYAEFLHHKAQHLTGERQKESVAAINSEIENIRAAWKQAAVQGREDDLEKSLIGLYQFYDIRSWFQEALTVFSEARASLQAAFSMEQMTSRKAIILGNLLSRQGWFSYRLGLSEQAKAFLQESLEILRGANAQVELAIALNELGIVTYRSGEYARAKQFYEESLAISRKLNDRRRLAITLNNLGNVCRALGEYAQARECLLENLEMMRETGDPFSIANALNNLGEVSRAQGNPFEAKQYYQQSLEIRREIGERMGVAVSLNNLGGIACTLGAYEEAKGVLQESLEIFTALGTRREQAYPLSILGRVARDLGAYEDSLTCYQKAVDVCMETQNVSKALDVLLEVALLLAKRGEKEHAVELAALVIHHAATQQETRCEAEGILSELEAELPSRVATGARERGQKLELEEAAKNLWLYNHTSCE